MKLAELLKQSGLSEKEIAVYETIIRLGGSPVTPIAAQSNINRSTAYVILDSLMKKKFVIAAERNGIKTYSPTPRATVIKNFEETAQHYAKLAAMARQLLPEIATGAAAQTAPKIRFFENQAEMSEVFATAVKSLEAIRDTKSKHAHTPANLPAGITISENKVFFVSADKKTGFMVESPSVAASLKTALQG